MELPAGSMVDVLRLDTELDSEMARPEPPRHERRRLTHFDRSGRPRMVDVSEKLPTAVAPWPRACSRSSRKRSA